MTQIERVRGVILLVGCPDCGAVWDIQVDLPYSAEFLAITFEEIARKHRGQTGCMCAEGLMVDIVKEKEIQIH